MPRVFLILGIACGIACGGIDLRLPTENHHLFTGDSDRFYMYVDRIFEGVASKPWQGGAYGFTRNAMRVNGEVVLTKFHEGIDIAPVNRDRAGNPLDLVTSIADGLVAYVSPIAGRSNYGKYVVVRHEWEGSHVYSLYAHLAEITCQPGNPVRAGSVLGRMGYTGVGLNRTRAHLHLELAMMTSSRYEEWHTTHGGGINHHGLFNGMNLIGVDVARFFLEHRENPELRFSDFVMSTQVYFKVAAPAKGLPDFVRRHPWICRGNPADAVSWEIAFSATGQPVSFTPSSRRVGTPFITQVRPSAISHGHMTRNLVIGSSNSASLTRGGSQLVALVTDDFPGPGDQAMEPGAKKPEG
jgi:murein DD-endopeptidase MepM/ murein hydrolase activator NlpD